MAVEVFEVLSVVMTSSPEMVRTKKFSSISGSMDPPFKILFAFVSLWVFLQFQFFKNDDVITGNGPNQKIFMNFWVFGPTKFNSLTCCYTVYCPHPKGARWRNQLLNSASQSNKRYSPSLKIDTPKIDTFYQNSWIFQNSKIFEVLSKSPILGPYYKKDELFSDFNIWWASSS